MAFPRSFFKQRVLTPFPFQEAVKLTPDEVKGLTENARRVALKYWNVKALGRDRTRESLLNTFKKGRWRFLDQAHEARQLLKEIAQDAGIDF